MAVIAPFPTPDLSGVPYSYYYADDPDWDALTVEHEYEDAGMSTNTTGDTPVLRWTLRFRGLYWSEAMIFDAHRALAQGRNHTFTFTDKEGVAHTGVRYKSYKRSHNGHISQIQEREIELEKRPA